MSSIDEPFLITQMFFFFVTTIFLFFLAHSIYASNDQIMNRIFGFTFLSLGITQLIFGFRNLYLLVFKEPLNLFSLLITARISFSFIPLALFCFFLTILIIRFGEEKVLKNQIAITIFLSWVLINLIVIWFTDSITLSDEVIGNLQTSMIFEIVVLGSTILLYILSYYYVLWSYIYSDEDLTWFLYGFTLCGLSLLSFGLSDYFRILDIISSIILTISMVVLYRGFSKYETYTKAFDELSPIPCLLIITSKGGLTLYTKEFINENFPTNLIGGYLASFNMISGEVFADESGPISLMKYKKYKLIMQSLDELTFAFLFKGSSKVISQKFGIFIDELKTNEEIWQELHKKAPRLTETQRYLIYNNLINVIN
jgi:hypothetical protein